MKKLKFKILIIVLCVATCFSLTGCKVNGVWDYFIKTFPETGLFPNNSAGGTPVEPDGNININQGTVNKSSSTLADVVEVIAPAVVEITTQYIYQTYQGQAYQKNIKGSGVIVYKDTDEIQIITNEHVVENGGNMRDEYGTYYYYKSMAILVKLTSGKEYSATRIYKDATEDIALLKVLKSDLKDEYDNVTLATIPNVYSITEGDRVLAIGNPLGTLGGTVTSGIISATEREQSIDGVTMTLIQTDAAINAGNSGGGLFSVDGKLIGIVNGKISRTGVEGIGFAIPIVKAIQVFHSQNLLTNLVCERGV